MNERMNEANVRVKRKEKETFLERGPSLENWTNVFLSFGQCHICQVTVVHIETKKRSEKLARIIASLSNA